MSTTLAQIGSRTLPTTPNPANMPKAQNDTQTVLLGIGGVVLLIVIAWLVIKFRRDD